MRHEVLLTTSAERDLQAIYDYIAEMDGRNAADRLLDRLLETCEGLAEFPERGGYPRELFTLGIREYRQVFFKPYRVVYRIATPEVFIILVSDGRRDMQTLLARRLFHPE